MIERAASALLGAEVVRARPVAGGDISEAFRLELADGSIAFAKRGGGADLPAEAAGLRWLAEAGGGPAVPEVLAVDRDLLILEWIEEGAGPLDEERLGRELAALHAAGADAHGALAPGVEELSIGRLRFPRVVAPTFAQAYGEGRLRPLIGPAGLSARGARAVERVIDRLVELVPEEPPARMHGDLWSGNVMRGIRPHPPRPWLIDPAPYGGHREVDLAMLRLFGGPGERCFAAYEEVWPLADGAGERVALWQLFPVLVHAVLFGGGYVAQAERIAGRFAG